MNPREELVGKNYDKCFWLASPLSSTANALKEMTQRQMEIMKRGASECAAAMAHAAAEGVTGEQSRAESRAKARTGRARPAIRGSGRGTDRRKRPAGGRAARTSSLCFSGNFVI
ncbi:unnamed protein product [Sphagnum jensenii]